MQVVAVAEPRKEYRDAIISAHDIAESNVFECWEDAVERERFADAVIICTQDQLHREPAIKFANLGYNILLEKLCRPILKTALTLFLQ